MVLAVLRLSRGCWLQHAPHPGRDVVQGDLAPLHAAFHPHKRGLNYAAAHWGFMEMWVWVQPRYRPRLGACFPGLGLQILSSPWSTGMHQPTHTRLTMGVITMGVIPITTWCVMY